MNCSPLTLVSLCRSRPPLPFRDWGKRQCPSCVTCTNDLPSFVMDAQEPNSHRPPLYPLDLLCRSNKEAILKFLLSFHEESSVATATAARAHPLPEASSKLARGTHRLDLLHRAFRTSAAQAAMVVETCFNSNKSWSYPRLKIGGFTLALGRLTRRHPGASRKLGSRADYVRTMCARNSVLDPQASLFDQPEGNTAPLIPDGACGALLVTEHCGPTADVPSFVGIWVPSEDLREGYHCYSLDFVIAYLRNAIAKGRQVVRKPIARKPLTIKKRPPQADR